MLNATFNFVLKMFTHPKGKNSLYCHLCRQINILRRMHVSAVISAWRDCKVGRTFVLMTIVHVSSNFYCGKLVFTPLHIKKYKKVVTSWNIFKFITAEKSLRQCLDFIETYKNHGGPLSEMDKNQNTPLMLFLSSSLLPSSFDDEMYTNALIDMLTINRTIVNKTNLSGVTPMVKAVSVGDYYCIKKLWDKGAKINIKDRQGNSLLHLSTLSGEFNEIL